MKRISFKVAKALKEAGYPQGYMGQDWCYENGQYPDESECDSPPPFTGYVLLPTYLEVWLWLIREKKIAITSELWGNSSENWGSIIENHEIYNELNGFSDPEDAIIASINYLIENKLLK